MKKTISVLLALIMLLSCSPVLLGVAFADDSTLVTFPESREFEFEPMNELLSGYNYVIPDGVTMTVPVGKTLYVPNSCTLTVQRGGELVLAEENGQYGEIIVSQSGNLTVDGTIVGAEHVTGSGIRQAQIRFPSLAQVGLKDTDQSYVRVWYATSTSGNAYENITPGFSYLRVPDEGADIYCPLNTYLYIIADIVKDGDELNKKYDDSLMNVYLNRVSVDYAGESHRTYLQSAGDITYSGWTNDDAFLRTYRVSLPSGTGYTVYGRDGEEGTAYVKWGKPFAFRVEVDDDYQMSSTTMDVYIYNGYGIVNYDYNNPNQGTTTPSTPDASGYYYIPAVDSDMTVYVSMLSITDEQVTKVGGILQTVRSIFEMIINFFRQIANTFGIGG